MDFVIITYDLNVNYDTGINLGNMNEVNNPNIGLAPNGGMNFTSPNYGVNQYNNSLQGSIPWNNNLGPWNTNSYSVPNQPW